MKKKLICLLLICLLLPALCVTALAEEEEYAQWTISEDGETLSLDGKTYTWYPLAYGEILQPKVRYVYENKVENPVNGEEYTVIVNPDNPNMVFLCKYRGSHVLERVYVTGDGSRTLDAYASGTFSEYLLTESGYQAAPVSSDLVSWLDVQTGNMISMEVIRLREYACYEIVGYDATHTIAHTHGGIYVLGDGYYYINYDALDNTYFTNNGDFSYRSGTVALLKLDAEYTRQVSAAIGELDLWDSGYVSESDPLQPELEENSAKIVFTILSVVVGLLIPAVPLVLGLVFARSKKSINPHKWYLLSILSALWIILTAVIVMMIIAPV